MFLNKSASVVSTGNSPRPSDIDPGDVPARLRFTRTVASKFCWVYDVPASSREDAVQEAHVAVLEAMPRYDANRPLKPFLCKVIRHRLCDWYFRRTLRLRFKAKLRGCGRYRSSSVEPDRSFDSKTTDMTDILDATEWLKPEQRKLVTDLLAGKSTDDIAIARKWKPAFIREQRQLAVHRLKALLSLGDEQ